MMNLLQRYGTRISFYVVLSLWCVSYILHEETRGSNSGTTQSMQIMSWLRTKENGGAGSVGEGVVVDFAEVDTNPVVSLSTSKRTIGSITRLCCNSEEETGITMESPGKALFFGDHCFLPLHAGNGRDKDKDGTNSTEYVNSPMPILVRPWMTSFKPYGFVLYYSSHVSQGIHVLGMESSSSTSSSSGEGKKHNGKWNPLEVELMFDSHVSCQSLYSPSIFVNDEEQFLYMYVSGHGCRSSYQSTYMFVSRDGIHWNVEKIGLELGIGKQLPLALPYSYFSVPVFLKSSSPDDNVHNGFYYALAKNSFDSGVSSLVRSESLNGNFILGPELGKDIRNAYLYVPPPSTGQSGIIYVFYTLIGDSPERILLGTIDTLTASSWKSWKLKPGPCILEPESLDEHGYAGMMPNRSGTTRGMTKQLRNPSFFPDPIQDGNTKDEDGRNMLNGTLFYAVQGGHNLAMASLSIDLSLFP